MKTHAPISGALNSLLGSGQLDLIQNVSLRDALAGWPARLEDLKEHELQDWGLAADRLSYLIAEYVPVADVWRGRLGGVQARSVHEADVEGLLRSRDFENLLGFRVAIKGGIRQDYQSLRAESERIVRLLRSELDDPG